MKKYYAVRKGRQIGIFEDWDTCKEAVIGYPCAEYSSFKDISEAKRFLSGEDIKKPTPKTEIKRPLDDSVNLVVEGSFNSGYISFGCMIQTKLKDYTFCSKFKCGSSLRGTAGELLGVLVGLQVIKDLDINKVHIYYKNQGVVSWYNGDWSCNGIIQSSYACNMKILSKFLDIDFIKSSGSPLVKKLAKRALTEYDREINMDTVFAGELNCKGLIR